MIHKAKRHFTLRVSIIIIIIIIPPLSIDCNWSNWNWATNWWWWIFWGINPMDFVFFLLSNTIEMLHNFIWPLFVDFDSFFSIFDHRTGRLSIVVFAVSFGFLFAYCSITTTTEKKFQFKLIICIRNIFVFFSSFLGRHKKMSKVLGKKKIENKTKKRQQKNLFKDCLHWKFQLQFFCDYTCHIHTHTG